MYKFKAQIWKYNGKAAWHFVTLPKKISKTIRQIFGDMSRGFGSLPVRVNLGDFSWDTSIFPDSKAGAYLLPIKSAVLKKENIKAGVIRSFVLEVKT